MDDYRGKCVSTHGKVTKAGEPKMAGNFSYSTFHLQSLQAKDYYVRLKTYASGIKTLIVGDHTPLSRLMGEHVNSLAMTDEHFDVYVRTGTKTVGVKKYEARMTLRKNKVHSAYWELDTYAFVYREEIYTDHDFNYQFPEY